MHNNASCFTRIRIQFLEIVIRSVLAPKGVGEFDIGARVRPGLVRVRRNYFCCLVDRIDPLDFFFPCTVAEFLDSVRESLWESLCQA